MAQIDFKGAVSLAATIISLLLILTYSQTDNSIDNYTSSAVNINVNNNNANSNTILLPQVLILLAIGIISLMGFIIIDVCVFSARLSGDFDSIFHFVFDSHEQYDLEILP